MARTAPRVPLAADSAVAKTAVLHPSAWNFAMKFGSRNQHDVNYFQCEFGWVRIIQSIVIEFI
jgi:hypothetical protein